jgi:ClpP class serine protease
MNQNLIYSLTRGKWAIDPQFALANISLVANILDGKIAVESTSETSDLEPYIVSKADSTNAVKIYDWTLLDSVPVGSVAVIRIMGSLMKQDQACGPIGMATIGQRIKRVDAHPNISAIVLHIDSPGGTVDGTADLAAIIGNTHKPVITFADGLMASAALWIGSHADEVFANNEFCEIGSVGVMTSFFDIIPYYEKEGLKYHQIVSSLSPDKRKMFDDIRAGKYEDYIKNDLDPIAVEFQTVIKQNCPNATDEHLTGKVFFAKNVLDVFVDSIGTLDDAIERAAILGVEYNKSNPNNTTNSNNANMKTYPLINAALNAELEADAEGNISFTPEMLDSIESNIEAKNTAETSITDLNTQIESVTGERDTAITKRDAAITERDDALANVETANATITTHEATITELRAKTPGATPADHGATEETAEKSDKTSEDKELEILAGMSIQERVAYTHAKENKK